MFIVNSFLMKPESKISDLNDVTISPQNYFVDITDSSGLKEISKDLDFQYLNGAICIKYYSESLMDFRYWDLVDQLWAYLVNVTEDLILKGEGSTYFPDQPVNLILRKTTENLLLFSIEGSEVSTSLLPKKEFLFSLLQGAEEFFSCLTDTFRFDCDYSYQLERIMKLKKEIE